MNVVGEGGGNEKGEEEIGVGWGERERERETKREVRVGKRVQKGSQVVEE
jgi:hypothetical protein